MEGGGAACGDLLTDDVGQTCCELCLYFLTAQLSAGISFAVKLTAVLFGLGLFAEAVVSVTLFHQQLRELAVKTAALGLNVGTGGTAHIGTLVVGQTALSHGAVDHFGRTLHKAGLVGILNAEDKGTACVAGDEPGVERGAEIAHVHIARGRGCKTGADLAMGDAAFQFFKITHIDGHTNSSICLIRRCGLAASAQKPIPAHITLHTIIFLTRKKSM